MALGLGLWFFWIWSLLSIGSVVRPSVQGRGYARMPDSRNLEEDEGLFNRGPVIQYLPNAEEYDDGLSFDQPTLSHSPSGSTWNPDAFNTGPSAAIGVSVKGKGYPHVPDTRNIGDDGEDVFDQTGLVQRLPNRAGAEEDDGLEFDNPGLSYSPHAAHWEPQGFGSINPGSGANRHVSTNTLHLVYDDIFDRPSKETDASSPSGEKKLGFSQQRHQLRKVSLLPKKVHSTRKVKVSQRVGHPVFNVVQSNYGYQRRMKTLTDSRYRPEYPSQMAVKSKGLGRLSTNLKDVTIPGRNVW